MLFLIGKKKGTKICQGPKFDSCSSDARSQVHGSAGKTIRRRSLGAQSERVAGVIFDTCWCWSHDEARRDSTAETRRRSRGVNTNRENEREPDGEPQAARQSVVRGDMETALPCRRSTPGVPALLPRWRNSRRFASQTDGQTDSGQAGRRVLEPSEWRARN